MPARRASRSANHGAADDCAREADDGARGIASDGCIPGRIAITRGLSRGVTRSLTGRGGQACGIACRQPRGQPGRRRIPEASCAARAHW